MVSPRFRSLDLGRRYAIVRLMLPRDRAFDILTYAPEEFREAMKRSIVLQSASEYWVRLT